jgi:hypothetical protein
LISCEKILDLLLSKLTKASNSREIITRSDDLFLVMSTQNNEDGESRALASKITKMGSDPVRNTAIENLTDRSPQTRQATNQPESTWQGNPNDQIQTNRSVTVSGASNDSSYGASVSPSQLEGRVSPLGVRVKEPLQSIEDDHVSFSSGDASKIEDPRSQTHQGRAKPDLSKVNVGSDPAKKNAAMPDMMGQGTQDAYLERGKNFGRFLENSPRDGYSSKKVRMIDDEQK